jgi:hypothetical protein
MSRGCARLLVPGWARHWERSDRLSRTERMEIYLVFQQLDRDERCQQRSKGTRIIASEPKCRRLSPGVTLALRYRATCARSFAAAKLHCVLISCIWAASHDLNVASDATR